MLKALRELDQDTLAGQVFAGGRIQRAVYPPPQEEIDEIRALSSKRYMMVHAAYVINMCLPQKDALTIASKKHLVEALKWAENLGFKAVTFHPGSAKERTPEEGWRNLEQNTKSVLSSYKGEVRLLFENSAGDKADKVIGRDIEGLLALSEQLGMGVCIDTVHAWAGGYDFTKIASLGKKADVIHFNIPKVGLERGSRLDRHGTLAKTDWSKKQIIDLASKLKRKPLIMETRDLDDAATLREWLAAA